MAQNLMTTEQLPAVPEHLAKAALSALVASLSCYLGADTVRRLVGEIDWVQVRRVSVASVRFVQEHHDCD